MTAEFPSFPLDRRTAASRTGRSFEPAPVRIVHLGLGAFHRAHQAWYTAAVDREDEWGIRAFTGRSPDAARDLAAQDGLYTLLERSTDGDDVSIVASISDAVDVSQSDVLTGSLAAEAITALTLTITEAGYTLDARGRLDLRNDAVAADVDGLRGMLASPTSPSHRPRTALARILLGIEERRRRGLDGFAVVPCDNLPSNGEKVKSGLRELAELAGAREAAAYVDESMSFVSTSVDRITPKPTDDDRRTVLRLSGWRDRAPVVTEPFHDWVLAGSFPAGRPPWEDAGARFVTDVAPFERRKLWMLNGAHSLLAFGGIVRGHRTVAEAVADPVVLSWVEQFWDEAAAHLPEAELDLPAYRSALVQRFQNASMRHLLAQIGEDGATKLRVRIAPVLLAERAAGRAGEGSTRALAAWCALAQSGRLPHDRSEEAVRDAAARGPESIRALLGVVHHQLGEDDVVVAGARRAVAELSRH